MDPAGAEEPGEEIKIEVLTSIERVHAVSSAWRALRQRAPVSVFGGYEWFRLWWDKLGAAGEFSPRVVVASRGGRVVAVLPLIVRRRGPLRFLEWAGNETFDYVDVECERAEDIAPIWRFSLKNIPHDVAVLRDVREGAASLPVLSGLTRAHGFERNYFLSLKYPSGDAWLAAQTGKLRGDLRRKAEKMAARGAVSFRVAETGKAPPEAVDALLAQKAAWFAARKHEGGLARPQAREFLRALAAEAARDERLYLAWLTCGDAIVACHMGFLGGGVLHLYQTTFAGAYATYSPGYLLMAETVQWAVDRKLGEIDFLRGDETYKTRFASGQRSLTTFMAGRTPWGRLAVWWRSRRAAAVAPSQED
jgi:CelD/BcsL family acetyltransferase involved in cellulose biosynthesis